MILCPASLTCGLLLCVALWTIPEVVAIQTTEFPVSIGSNETFYCNESSRPVWVIMRTDGIRLITDKIRDVQQLPEKGFFPQNDSAGRVYLTVQATAENNNTNISCRSRIFENSDSEFYLIARLQVLGPPSYPEPFLQLINATTLLLSWSSPFTWADFEIQNYNIKMLNTSNGDMVVRNTDATPNETIITEYFSTSNGEAAQSCMLLKFSVSATSTIGESRPGNTSGGFPIVPRNFTVDHELSFRRDGTPKLRVEFVPPYICPFQMAEYSIEIQQTGTDEIFTFGPEEFSYAERQSEVQIFTAPRLVLNAEYMLTITVSTVAGNSSITTNFSTEFSPPTTVTVKTGSTEFSPLTTVKTDTTEPRQPQTSQLSLPLTVGIAVGVSAVLVLLILSIICVLTCQWSLKKRRKPATLSTYKGPPPTPMANNPLYVGAQEPMEHPENIEPYSVVRLPATKPMSHHPGLPSIPPPRKRNEADSGRDSIETVEQISTSSGEYTNMNSVRMMANLQPRGGNTNDGERYAIHMSN